MTSLADASVSVKHPQAMAPATLLSRERHADPRYAITLNCSAASTALFVGDGSLISVEVTVANNRVWDTNIGIDLDSGGNVARRNDARGNEESDCHDHTFGSGTDGTDNTWIGNLGENDEPSGICKDV